MKERSFYVINLDNKRLFIVGLTSLAIMGGFFAFGFRLGTQQSPKPSLMAGSQPPQVQLKGNPVESTYPDPTANSGKPQYETIDLSAPSQPPPVKQNPGQANAAGTAPVAGGQAGTQSKYSQNDPNPIVPPPGKVDTSKPVSADAPKAVSSSSKTKKGKKYTVQIAAFKKLKRAQKAKDRLAKRKISSYIVKGSNYYFVRSGKANNKAELKKKKAKIKKRTTYEPIIIKSKL